MKLTHSIIANAFYAGTFLLVASFAAECFAQTKLTATPAPARLQLPGESLTIQDRPAFIYMPEESKRSTPQPWVFYAPTLPAYPDEES